jgi:cell division protein FtsZ
LKILKRNIMAEDLMNFDLPQNKSSIIKVLGIGGGGSNAVNNMFNQGIKDVDFLICNTDAQALYNSPVPVKIQIGESLTEGRGAGNKPEIGREAAIENLENVMAAMGSNTKMLFITAGMGGGTGTGAAPIIAKAAQDAGILTVAIITIPFKFEGQKRINQAIDGINELKEHVDSLLVINNEKLREIFGDLKLSEAFARADDVLTRAAKSIAEIITVHGYINVDFADVETVMQNSGVAIMGSGSSKGEGRSVQAIKEAIASPLLNNNDITGAKNILLNITSGIEEVSMDEVGEITDYVTANVDKNALIIWGTCMDESLQDQVNVTIIATGFEAASIPELYIRKKQLSKVPLEEKKDIRPGEQKIFEVKDRSVMRDNVVEPGVSHAATEINLFSSEDDLTDEEKMREAERKKERMKRLKKSQGLAKETNKKSEEDNIDELENEPAYIRKKIQLDKEKRSSKSQVSRYSLSEDDEKNVELNDDNAYLHDNVD